MTDILDQLRSLIGAAHVLTGADAASYGADFTGHYRWQPLAVLRPGSVEDVSAIMALASRTGTPVVPVSGGTGLNGGHEAQGRLMLSLSRLNKITQINPAARTVAVEAGVILETLHAAVAEHGLMFPLSFGAKGSAQVGGFLSTNAGGSNVVRYGNARALCLGLEVVLADGRVMNLMTALHKDNTGYDLRNLMIGAEGTLGIITAAVLKLVPAPRERATALLGMTGFDAALRLLNRLQEGTGGAVEAFEYLPDIFWPRLTKYKPDLSCPITPQKVNILLEIATTVPGDDPQARLEDLLEGPMEAGEIVDAVLASSEAQRAKLWHIRESAAEVTLNEMPIVDTDVALPLDQISPWLDHMGGVLDRLDPKARLMVIGHLGDGNLHYTVFPSDETLVQPIRDAISREAVAMGGTFSAEHGVGLSKRASMGKYKDPVALQVMAAIKSALDPQNILNPGKLLP
ncbi:FAD-dependent oxidoreductase [Thioclava sp. SK-1]|uniref:FAD-binding oxidoreductase n=1 Tax=Thioclava sp. SK-1 TaxID=1889770 RepID=UPI000824EF2E|nr:FAD-binding oxidoreductase [Thioclava sp. SK-1]OCX66653.1 FAD-dependent oxidoreductase [Thioclava sp. SK-1]